MKLPTSAMRSRAGKLIERLGGPLDGASYEGVLTRAEERLDALEETEAQYRGLCK